MAEYGYIRVSTEDQSIDRQVIALSARGIDKANIFIDRQSGKDFARPAWRRMMRRLKPGDALVVKSIDRLGRDYDEIIDQWRLLTKGRDVDIAVIDMPLLDTRADRNLLGRFISDLVLQILSYVAHTERELLLQRQAEGIAAAKTKGVRFGRPEVAKPRWFFMFATMWEQGELSTKDFSSFTGWPPTTLYRKLRDDGFHRARPETEESEPEDRACFMTGSSSCDGCPEKEECFEDIRRKIREQEAEETSRAAPET
jgi:DNA invertase Pin-like site-specific DNA recombinase